MIDKLVDAKVKELPEGLSEEERSELEKLEDEISEYLGATRGHVDGY